MTGILHLGAPRWADLTLMIQAAMAVAMTVGAILARRKHFRAHGIIETSAVLLNLVMIGAFMLPSFPRHIWRKAPTAFMRPHIAVVVIHALMGGIAELLGLYVVLSAGTHLVPERLRLQDYRWWMRITFVFWWMALVAGGMVYYVWYVATPHS